MTYLTEKSQEMFRYKDAARQKPSPGEKKYQNLISKKFTAEWRKRSAPATPNLQNQNRRHLTLLNKTAKHLKSNKTKTHRAKSLFTQAAGK